MTTPKNQYSTIAQSYAESEEERITRKYLANPAFFELLGDLEGKVVLDLACGDGFLTRQIKHRGASIVWGVDLSDKMIELARAEEKRNPLGIEYRVCDVASKDIVTVPNFDIVTAGFLLHYSRTREELRRMCNNIYSSLKDGGRFVAINQNPDCPHTTHKEYGSTIHPIGKLREGGKIQVNLWKDNRKICSFVNYHWNKSSYEQALADAGFKDVRWLDIKPSREGIQEFGREFWKGWLESPTIALIEARK